MWFLPNQSKNDGSFLLETADIREARRKIKATGLRQVGVFHSHPVGYAHLGPRDRKSTPQNWLHLVYDVCALEPKLWRVIRHGRRRAVIEVPLVVQRSSNDGRAR
jgi:proteasome lid subunit RPN8/RPN11